MAISIDFAGVKIYMPGIYYTTVVDLDVRHHERFTLEYNVGLIPNSISEIAAFHQVFYKLTGMCEIASWSIAKVEAGEQGAYHVSLLMRHNRKPRREE